MLQLTPQSRIFVAMGSRSISAKGPMGACRVAAGCSAAIPSAAPSMSSATARAPRSKSCCYDGQGFWLCTKRLSHGHFTNGGLGRRTPAHVCLRVSWPSCCGMGIRNRPGWRTIGDSRPKRGKMAVIIPRPPGCRGT